MMLAGHCHYVDHPDLTNLLDDLRVRLNPSEDDHAVGDYVKYVVSPKKLQRGRKLILTFAGHRHYVDLS